MDSARKCKFHRFCPARSDCSNIAHAILSCYRLQGAFNQFNGKIWKLQLKYFSYNSSSGENAKILSDCVHVVLVNKTVTSFDLFVGPFKRRDMSLMARVPNFIL